MLFFRKTWLMIRDAQLPIDSGEDTLYLSHGKHTTQKRVTRIVSVVTLIEYAARLIGEGHTMVHSHRETTTRIALAFLLCLLEDAAKFDEMATTT